MDDLLLLPWVEPLERELGRDAVKSLFNEVLTETRRAARDGGIPFDICPVDAIHARARALMNQRAASSLAALVNATGVVVHTNLGRSPLPASAIDAVVAAARGYSSLEFDLESGTRGHRNAHVEWLLCQLTGAEAAVVVNNNAGAVLLGLAALASGREVVVSCGELVEIGGSFRIPEILSFSGAKMVAVGCTNCTHLRDYRDAVGENTAMLLKVHPSNFRIDGFTESVPREELAALARARGVICMEDLGSGMLEPLGVRGLGGEPTVRECVAAGVDLVTFSGDKLLGGPQIGCIAGSRGLIDRIRKHQLIRALRVDKMTLAAFEVILRMYLQNRSDEIPTIAMLRCTDEELKLRSGGLMEILEKTLSEMSVSSISLELVRTEDTVGGGSFPASALDGWGVALVPAAGIRAEKLAAKLRACKTPVITGIQDGRLILHVRTLMKGDSEVIAGAIREIFGG